MIQLDILRQLAKLLNHISSVFRNVIPQFLALMSRDCCAHCLSCGTFCHFDAGPYTNIGLVCL